jgi:hypothetical protein
MKAEYWRKMAKHGLRNANQQYYAQVQIYMAYFELTNCIFTALNKDTAELYQEPVPFDACIASFYSDRAVEILRACDANEEKGRLSSNPDYFECKMCRYKNRCWNKEANQ